MNPRFPFGASLRRIPPWKVALIAAAGLATVAALAVVAGVVLLALVPFVLIAVVAHRLFGRRPRPPPPEGRFIEGVYVEVPDEDRPTSRPHRSERPGEWLAGWQTIGRPRAAGQPPVRSRNRAVASCSAARSRRTFSSASRRRPSASARRCPASAARRSSSTRRSSASRSRASASAALAAASAASAAASASPASASGVRSAVANASVGSAPYAAGGADAAVSAKAARDSL
jgi:hypothetical protein